MDIDYQDLVLLNTRLREEDIRYRVTYKNPSTACLEPPGACCCTPERQEGAYRVIRDYYQSKGIQVTFSQDGLYFILPKIPGEGGQQSVCRKFPGLKKRRAG